MWGSPAERLVSLEGSKLQEMNQPRSHWNHETQCDSSWSVRGWHLRMCWPSMWGRTNTNFTLSNSLVYPWNNMLSSSLNFLLDCNWSRTLLFSILVCDVALRKLTMSSPEKCKSSHHLPPPMFLCSGSFFWNLTYCIFNHLSFPMCKAEWMCFRSQEGKINKCVRQNAKKKFWQEQKCFCKAHY